MRAQVWRGRGGGGGGGSAGAGAAVCQQEASMRMCVAGLVCACEALLAVVGDLKRRVVLGNGAATRDAAARHMRASAAATAAVCAALAKARDDVAVHTARVEAALAACPRDGR